LEIILRKILNNFGGINMTVKKLSGLVVLMMIIVSCAKKPNINETEFKDKIFACWLGKNIGGTLGMPFEAKSIMNDAEFYTNLKEGEPAANDDLDLQLLWLKAMEENNMKVDAFTLGKYWLQFVPVNCNEYGVGKANMKKGIMPPLSGQYENAHWRTSNGAWIRSEIWACLYPGNPEMAARMAWEDACVDHGTDEGTYAEIFTATLESAAFVESDHEKLIDFALSMIPAESRMAKAINVVIKAHKDGKDWKETRQAVVDETKDMGWFQAPENVAFTMIGLLWGNGDFGKSICIAVNCGDDTDCTGATLGSIMGILNGTKGIPDKWRKPIGIGIVNVAISGFDAPKDLNILTDKTLAAAKKIAASNPGFVQISNAPSNLQGMRSHLLHVGASVKNELCNRSPYIIKLKAGDLLIVLDYMSMPDMLNNQQREIKLILENTGKETKDVKVAFKGVEGIKLEGLKPEAKIEGSSKLMMELKIIADNMGDGFNKCSFVISDAAGSYEMPLTLRKSVTADPVFSINDTNITQGQSVEVALSDIAPDAEIKYIINGKWDDSKAIFYKSPITVSNDACIIAKAFQQGTTPSNLISRQISVYVPGKNGWNYKYYEGKWSMLPDFSKQKIVKSGTCLMPDEDKLKLREDYFGLDFNAFLVIEKTDRYTFYVSSDDGAKLWINNKLILVNDSLHPVITKSAQVQLSKGVYPVRLSYFDNWAGDDLMLEYESSDFERQAIPAGKILLKKQN
jgi:ADP-ribosylglycohydrolase